LLVFSFSHVDDVTWGTKGIAGGSGKSMYYGQKVSFIGKWLVANYCLTYGLILLSRLFSEEGYVLYVLGGYATFI